MQVFDQIIDATPSVTGSVVTMGNFDGIHLGHQALVSRAVESARRRDIPSVVLTFDPHPLKVIAPDRAPRLILTRDDKTALLRELGVDVIINQIFDASFAAMAAEQFVHRFIVGALKTREIWVGRDLRFGQGRQGNVEKLLDWGREWGFEVGIVEPILVGGMRVSSSRIRGLIESGDVGGAEVLLGRHPFVTGTVVQGHRRGRLLGFPTANIESRTEVLPADGIYATLIEIGGERRPSVSSIGLNPTFGAGPRTVESYILGFDREIYGESVRLAFVQRLRDEMKFADVDGLVRQIRDDVRAAREVFASLGLDSPAD